MCGLSELCGRLRDGHKFVTAKCGLLLESGFDALLPHSVALRPERSVVFHLSFDHRVKDDGDFMGGGCSSSGRSQFGFHAAEIITHRRLIVMQ